MVGEFKSAKGGAMSVSGFGLGGPNPRGSKSAVTPANPVCRSAHCRDIHWSSDSVHGSNSTVLHSMIKIVDLTYNTRDKIISFYLGK